MKPEYLLRQEPEDYSTIYIDMDSFFASVEQYYEPRLRGKPVGVATGSGPGASIIAASYSAKRCGIHTGTKIEEALKVCPNIAIVNGNHKRYKAVHYAIMAILHDTFCQVQAKGIDEAWLKVPSYARNREQVFALCKAIKLSIYELYSEHINCSIGIASNIWLAKMAASRYKPNGLGCVCLADLPNFYRGTKLIALTGIGRRMVRQFASRGITTPSRLYQEEWRSLGKHYGVLGQKWYLRMRGYEVDKVPLPQRKSLGHQVTITGTNTDNLAQITTYGIKIAEVLGRRLRSSNLLAQGLYISLFLKDHTYTQSYLSKLQSFDTDELIIYYTNMLLKKLTISSPLKRISITLMDLTPIHQLYIWPLSATPDDHMVSTALDKVKNRYGEYTTTRADSFFDSNFLLDRVGFAGDMIRDSIELS